MKIFVLTVEVNGYDQYGNYYVASFLKKPTVKQIQEAIRAESFDYLNDEKCKRVINDGCADNHYTSVAQTVTLKQQEIT